MGRRAHGHLDAMNTGQAGGLWFEFGGAHHCGPPVLKLYAALPRKLMREGSCPAAVTQRMHFHPDSVLPFTQLQRARTARHPKMPMMAPSTTCQFALASND